MADDERRPWGSGSVFRHKGRWTASVTLPSENSKRRRRWIRCATREDAERVVAQLIDGNGPPRAPRHARLHRLTPLGGATFVFQRGRALGWDDAMLAQAMVAGLAVKRLQLGVIGPCVYCGDELANTVDHVDPSAGDGPENVVSACRSCNVAKGKRTPEQWRSA